MLFKVSGLNQSVDKKQYSLGYLGTFTPFTFVFAFLSLLECTMTLLLAHMGFVTQSDTDFRVFDMHLNAP